MTPVAPCKRSLKLSDSNASPFSQWMLSAQVLSLSHLGRPERLTLITSAPIRDACSHTLVPTKPLPPKTTMRGIKEGKSVAEVAVEEEVEEGWLDEGDPLGGADESALDTNADL